MRRASTRGLRWLTTHRVLPAGEWGVSGRTLRPTLVSLLQLLYSLIVMVPILLLSGGAADVDKVVPIASAAQRMVTGRQCIGRKTDQPVHRPVSPLRVRSPMRY